MEEMFTSLFTYISGTEEIRKTKMAANMTKSSNDVMEAQPGFTGTCKEFPSILKDLLTNLTFVFSSLAHVGDSVIVVGFASFGPKYIENQFSISASLASMLFGEQQRERESIPSDIIIADALD